METLQDADANLDQVARNTRSVTITSDMADSSGNIDAIVYADEFATDDIGCNRHGFVEVNGERADLTDPTSVEKFQQLNIANTGPEYRQEDPDSSEPQVFYVPRFMVTTTGSTVRSSVEGWLNVAQYNYSESRFEGSVFAYSQGAAFMPLDPVPDTHLG